MSSPRSERERSKVRGNSYCIFTVQDCLGFTFYQYLWKSSLGATISGPGPFWLQRVGEDGGAGIVPCHADDPSRCGLQGRNRSDSGPGSNCIGGKEIPRESGVSANIEPITKWQKDASRCNDRQEDETVCANLVQIPGRRWRSGVRLSCTFRTGDQHWSPRRLAG